MHIFWSKYRRATQIHFGQRLVGLVVGENRPNKIIWDEDEMWRFVGSDPDRHVGILKLKKYINECLKPALGDGGELWGVVPVELMYNPKGIQ